MEYSASRERITIVVANQVYILPLPRYSVLAKKSTLQHMQEWVIGSKCRGAILQNFHNCQGCPEPPCAALRRSALVKLPPHIQHH